MKNIFLILSIIASFWGLPAGAYPSPAAKESILDLLNGKAQKGQLESVHPVSFDDLHCVRAIKSCTLSLRFMIPQDDFFIVRKGSCVVEPVDTVYDILDDKSGDLTNYFLKAIKNCL